MAKAKPQPTGPKPDPELARQVTDDVTRRLREDAAPEGAQAALPKVDWGRIVPALVGPFLEVATMGADGRIDPSEAARIGQIIFEAITRVRSGG